MTKTSLKTEKNPKTTWRRVRLGDFADINPPVSLVRGKEYPFMDMANVAPLSRTTKWMERKTFTGSGARFDEGDTLFARITPCLENGKITHAVKIGGPGFGSTEFYVLRGKKKISDSDFIFYLTRTYRIRKLAEASMLGASGRQRVERAAFEKIEVTAPEDVEEQKRIASVLAAFDEKIENNNRIIKTLEEMAQAIFKEWFLQNDQIETREGKVNDLVRIISGHPFSSTLYTSDKQALGVVTIKNVQDGNFVFNFDSFIHEDDVPQNMNEDCLLEEGDVLLSLTGNVGRVCFVYGGSYLLNQRVAKLKPRNELDQAFVYFLFRQPLMQSRLIAMAKGSAQPNLSPVETGQMEYAIPSRDALDKFSLRATPIFQHLVGLAAENKRLAAMRDLLLPRLMSGEIRV